MNLGIELEPIKYTYMTISMKGGLFTTCVVWGRGDTSMSKVQVKTSNFCFLNYPPSKRIELRFVLLLLLLVLCNEFGTLDKNSYNFAIYQARTSRFWVVVDLDNTHGPYHTIPNHTIPDHTKSYQINPTVSQLWE